MEVYWVEQKLSDIPGEDDWLSAAEHSHLRRLQSPKRRSDWRLGRWTAKRVVSAFLHWPQTQLNAIEIHSSCTGAPEVFVPNRSCGPSISISHSAGVCMCVIASVDAPLGCDLERLEPRDDCFLQTFFTDDEIAAMADLQDDQRATMANVIWSAKESCLKYTREGLNRDTREVQITMPSLCTNAYVETSTDWFSLLMTIDGREIYGQTRLWNGFVEAIAGTRSVPAPLSTLL